MQQVNPYKTVKRGEPPIRAQPVTGTESHSHRTRGVIHALARARDDRNDQIQKTKLCLDSLGFMPECQIRRTKVKQYII